MRLLGGGGNSYTGKFLKDAGNTGVQREFDFNVFSLSCSTTLRFGYFSNCTVTFSCSLHRTTVMITSSPCRVPSLSYYSLRPPQSISLVFQGFTSPQPPTIRYSRDPVRGCVHTKFGTSTRTPIYVYYIWFPHFCSASRIKSCFQSLTMLSGTRTPATVLTARETGYPLAKATRPAWCLDPSPGSTSWGPNGSTSTAKTFHPGILRNFTHSAQIVYTNFVFRATLHRLRCSTYAPRALICLTK